MKAPSTQSTQQPSQPSTSSAKTKNIAIKKLEADVVDIRGTCSSIANDVQQMSALLNNILALQPGIHGIQPHPASTSVQAAPVPSGVDVGRPSCSAMASRSLPPLHPPRPTVSKPLDTEMVMRSVCSEMKDKERRRRNVIVSGLEPDERYNDATLFGNICDTFLDIDVSGEINLSLTRRLPSNKAIEPLLVVFKRKRRRPRSFVQRDHFVMQPRLESHRYSSTLISRRPRPSSPSRNVCVVEPATSPGRYRYFPHPYPPWMLSRTPVLLLMRGPVLLLVQGLVLLVGHLLTMGRIDGSQVSNQQLFL